MREISDEITKEQTPPTDWPPVSEPRQRRRESPSLFGPIVLISLGVYFLLNNLGYATSLNWAAALQLWPLVLIFLGLNVIVRQVPRPFGSFLSALVALTAVAVFGYVLVAGEDNALLNRFGVQSGETVTLQRQEIAYGPEGIETAVVRIDFGMPAAELYELDDSRELLQGVITYRNSYNLATREEGSKAFIELDTRDSSGLSWINPTNWFGSSDDDQWQLGLSPDVALDLRLDVGAGMVDLDLHGLTLADFMLDGGAGRVELRLPDGEYDAELDGSAGSLAVWLPANGRQSIDVNGGAGSSTFYLPASMAARVIVNDGAGSFRLNNDRFTRVSGDEPDDGIWETADYDDAINRLELKVDIGAGSVGIESTE